MRRLHFPATARNRDPILATLRRVLPPDGVVLEIGSGSGEHARHFADALAPRNWQPTDLDPAHLASIAAYAEEAASPYLRPPFALDASWPVWPVVGAAAVVAINLVHIAPWTVCAGLVAGAGRCLRPGGVLYLYGPFRRQGVATAPSNERFDAALRAQNPQWGIRELGEVTTLATEAALLPDVVEEMPANNLSIVYRRATEPG